MAHANDNRRLPFVPEKVWIFATSGKVVMKFKTAEATVAAFNAWLEVDKSAQLHAHKSFVMVSATVLSPHLS